MRREGLLAFVLCAFLMGTSMLSSGCKRDKCKKVNCENGQCVEGECACELGYEGSFCETVSNLKFAGTYELTEQCSAGTDFYEVFMEADQSSPWKVRIAGLWEQANDTIVLKIAQDGLDFTIDRQSIGGNEITATGEFDDFDQNISIDYQIYTPGASSPFDECSAQLQK